MPKLSLVKGSTDVSVDIFVQDSSSATGAGLTGLVFNSASLTARYHRPGAVSAALSLVTQTVTGAHTDGGFVEIDSTNMPGFYRLDLSDAIVATGVDFVSLMLRGATNMADLPLEIQLTNLDLNDGTRAGLTALPNAAADAAGGLPISDAGGLDLDARLDAAVSSRATPAQVNTEVVDVIRTDTPAELSATPAAAPDIDTMIRWLYQKSRDERDESSATGLDRVKNNAGTVISQATITDDGTIATRGRYANP